MSQAHTTTDHAEIQRWVEARNGHPAYVKSTRSRGGGLLRIDFDQPEQSLDQIGWDEFFKTFDENHLAFIYQEKTSTGRKSRFNKFVRREAVEGSDESEDSDDSRSAASEAEDEDER